jgi:hypothetical protein
MGIVIEQATWGDENYTTDITKPMQEKAKQGYLDLVADNTLVPALDLLTGSQDVVLTDDEKTEIKKKATEICGSASDEKCINFNKNQFESSLLQKKVAEKQSSANIITGRRLTLTYKDEATGRKQTVAIPDGQKVVAGKKPEFQAPDLSGLTPSSTILRSPWIRRSVYVNNALGLQYCSHLSFIDSYRKHNYCVCLDSDFNCSSLFRFVIDSSCISLF